MKPELTASLSECQNPQASVMLPLGGDFFFSTLSHPQQLHPGLRGPHLESLASFLVSSIAAFHGA